MTVADIRLSTDTHALVCYDKIDLPEHLAKDLQYVYDHFCGKVYALPPYDPQLDSLSPQSIVYLCGNLNSLKKFAKSPEGFKDVRIVKEFSTGYDDSDTLVSAGELPLNIHNVGVYFRDFFGTEGRDYFHELTKEHTFQVLTESNKPGTSYRKGIYLSDVNETESGTEFNLLRCSTNLEGPTAGFKQVDKDIVGKVNQVAIRFFPGSATFNHVLAQVYENKVEETEDHKKKERKARIKTHSDKTKDMPDTALIAFTTFYSDSLKTQAATGVAAESLDPYDRRYKNSSVLTELRFRLKECVQEQGLVKAFTLKLYPNSVFIMPLETNRLYTHEIGPPLLPVDKIPTRLGYVIRSSKTPAVFKDGIVHLKDGQDWKVLRKTTLQDIVELKQKYLEENITDHTVEYGPIDFSLNDGDYLKPIL